MSARRKTEDERVSFLILIAGYLPENAPQRETRVTETWDRAGRRFAQTMGITSHVRKQALTSRSLVDAAVAVAGYGPWQTSF